MTPKIPPQLMEAVSKVVLAGMKLMYAPEVRQKLIDALSAPGEWPDKIATQVAGMMKMLDLKAEMKIPKPAIVPAAAMLMQEMFNFVSKTTDYKPTDEDMAAAMQILTKLILAEYKAMDMQAQQQPPANVPQQPVQPQGLLGAVQ